MGKRSSIHSVVSLRTPLSGGLGALILGLVFLPDSLSAQANCHYCEEVDEDWWCGTSIVQEETAEWWFGCDTSCRSCTAEQEQDVDMAYSVDDLGRLVVPGTVLDGVSVAWLPLFAERVSPQSYAFRSDCGASITLFSADAP